MNKKRISIIVFIIGILALIAGAVFLLLNILKKPNIRDAEYLVQIGTWQEQDSDSVIWEFYENGHGMLTTNNSIDKHSFIWAIEGDTLKIETNWLYDLENEYIYVLSQKDNTLTLTEDEKTTVFIPAPESLRIANPNYADEQD